MRGGLAFLRVHKESEYLQHFCWDIFFIFVRRTNSFSSGEPRYSPGEILGPFTICSNELGDDIGGSLVSGFVKARFTERRIVCLPSTLLHYVYFCVRDELD
jgi:hypothetical protein